ncbi:Pinin-like protein [Hirschfeldia incana]|nr:Pinin-like protein [Hirschfeldia incana]
METKNESKEQQWTDSISQSSSSRSSSITSDSSDGHFDIRHFPLPKPTLSAAEAQKQRETHQAYNSSVSSYTGSSWSSVRQNNLADLPGYDPNRIPSSVFSSKQSNSTDWSIASNESLFSIHDGNFSISTREDHGVPAGLRLGEIPRFEEPVNEITEIKAVPLPLPPPTLAQVQKPTESEEEMIPEKKQNDDEESDSEISHDDQNEETEITELESDNEHEEEEEEDIFEEKVEKQKLKEEVEDAKDNKTEDTNSTVSHSPTISCRSDTSNNSVCSFAFPVLQNENGVDKTPSLEIRGNVSHNARPEYSLPQSPMQPPQPETLSHSEPQPQSQPQREASRKRESQTQSPKNTGRLIDHEDVT